MANSTDFRSLSKARMQVSIMLMGKGDYNGVVDNVGFSIELALKAIICKKLKIPRYPDLLPIQPSRSQRDVVNFFKTHDLVTLLLLSGCTSDFDVSTTTNPDLASNWGQMITWSPDVRYEPVGTYDQMSAQSMLDAANSIPHGVMTYLKKRW